jgi:hypothetical protein
VVSVASPVSTGRSLEQPDRHRRPKKLSPLVDSVAQRLVFAPTTDVWFLGAVRDSAFGVDVGRVDFDVHKTPARFAAFREAVAESSPIALGARLRLRGAWGQDDVTIAGFDARAGRVLARVTALPVTDSLSRAASNQVASAQLVRDSAAPTRSTCDRSLPANLKNRVARAADSLEAVLRRGEQPVYTRLQRAIRARKSHLGGCFGEARALAVASIYAGDYEWVRERAVLLTDSGSIAATIRDLRFRAHEALHAFDADGDGVDDVAFRAWTPRATATVILKLAEGAKFERLAAGFAVER